MMTGVSLGLTRPGGGAWWPAGARYAADFVNGRYMRDGTPITQASALTLTRGSGKWAADRNGVWSYFGPDTLARTNAGALIEPAGTNLIPNPGLSGAVVGVIGAGGSLPTGWYVNGVLSTEVLAITTFMGLPALRIRVSGVASGTFYELNMCPAATAMSAAVRYSASVFLQVADGLVPEIQLRQATTSDSLVAVIALSNSDARLQSIFTSQASTNRARLRLTCTVNVGQSYVSDMLLACPQLEEGQSVTSPLLSERLRDVCVLQTGAAGTLRVQYTDGATNESSVNDPSPPLPIGSKFQLTKLDLA